MDLVPIAINLAVSGGADGCKELYKFLKNHRDKKKRDELIKDDISKHHVAFDWGFVTRENAEALKQYVNTAIEEIVACLCLTRETQIIEKYRLLDCAYGKANAHTVQQQREVYKYLCKIMEIVGNNVLDKNGDLLVANYIIGETHEAIDAAKKEWKACIEAASDRTLKELNTIKNTVEYTNSFAEMIDDIDFPSAENIKFHYLNENFEFYGRTNEIADLDAFLDSSELVLFKVITGSAGAGKSKLLYEYAKLLNNNPRWKTVFFSASRHIKDQRTAHPIYPRNLLIVIDYAGQDVNDLGEWLELLCTCTKQLQDKKIRIVLLEREGLSTDGTGDEVTQRGRLFGKYPYWYDSLLKSAKSSANKEKIERKTSFLELGFLSSADLEKLLDKYAATTNRTFTSEQKKAILSYCDEIEKVGERVKGVRPLIVLLAAEAWLDKKFCAKLKGDKGDLDELLFYIVEKRYEAQWEKTLCNKVETRVSLEGLLVYATATGGWAYSDKASLPSSLRQGLDELEKIFDRGELQKVLQALNEKTRGDKVLFPMVPDLIGEYLVLNYVQKISNDSQSLVSAFGEKYEYLYFLERCINDFATSTHICEGAFQSILRSGCRGQKTNCGNPSQTKRTLLQKRRNRTRICEGACQSILHTRGRRGAKTNHSKASRTK